jgi:hypothetical protein
MTNHSYAVNDGYNPNKLLDLILDKLELKSDAAMSRKLDISAPILSKIRHGLLPVGASILIRMHETTGLTISELQAAVGNRRAKHRYSKPRKRMEP